MTNPDTARLTAAVYDALVEFQKTAEWPQLALAQMRQHLAEHVAAAVSSAGRAALLHETADTGLRDRIAEELAARFTADGDVTRGMRVIDPDDENDPEPARRVLPIEAADVVAELLRRLAAEQPTNTERRRLTPNEHSAAWHAIEGSAGEEGADPGTVLKTVLWALGIDAPDEQERPVGGEQPDTQETRPADALVADARRAVHEALVVLAAPEADRVRALIADLETAVEGRTAIRMSAP